MPVGRSALAQGTQTGYWPAFTAAPVILGSPQVGIVATFLPGTVTGTPTPTRTNEWLIDNVVVGTAATYTPTVGQDGVGRLKVRETAINYAGVATSTSVAVTVQPQANEFLFTGPTTGTTGVASTFQVRPNNALSANCTVDIIASPPGSATLSVSSMFFPLGATAAQSFTVTRATDGTSTVSISNTLNLANTGSPISFTSSAAVTTEPAAYRSEQPYLFSSIQTNGAGLPREDARIAGGSPYSFDGLGGTGNAVLVGPAWLYVDERSGWVWDNPGGDWIDATLTRQGSTPWASQAVAAGSGVQTYSINVTAALKHAYQLGRWNSWILRIPTGVLTVALRFHATPSFRPSMFVTYTDSTTATLACRVSAQLESSSVLPSQTGATASLTATKFVALEFERPSKPVASATLAFTVTVDWGNNVTLQFNLADPSLNVSQVGYGVAKSYPLDAGITGNSSVIFSHRYQDGVSRRDVILQTADNPIGGIDFGSRAPFSPELWGGAADTGKVPYVGAGKWIGGILNYPNAGDTDPNFGIVPSSYTGDGFVPLAAGLGALRVHMPEGTDTGPNDTGSPIVDGSIVTGSSPTIRAHMFMPAAKFGVLREGWLRYYVRIGTPYAPTLTDKHQYYANGNAVWTDMGGKAHIGFSHWSHYGGNNNFGAGGHGWSMRPEFSDNMTDMDPKAPQYRSYGTGLSWVDMQSAYNPSTAPYGQPVGYTGTAYPRGDIELGQRGGAMSNLYPGRWYCIEEHIKLNSVDQVNAGEGDGRFWTPDGELEWYIDGKLAQRKTGLVFRALPANPGDGTHREPFREIGIADIVMNFYHGGVTKNVYPRTFFYAGLVVAEQRIGPMAGRFPSWRAA